VRGVARRLGRLARNTGVLGVIGVLSFAASGADAAPPPQQFLLTISATSVAKFDHTSAPVTLLECETSQRAEGARTAVLRSSRPTLVRFVDGRIQTVVLRRLKGTVKLSGTNTANMVCAGVETQTPEPCAKTTRRFAGARVTFSSAGRGSITIRPPHVALRRIQCPQEPDDFLALPLGPPPGPLHISLASLRNARTTRITLTASGSRTKTYGAPEAGTLQQRTAWKVTFVRTGR
jgi:hypothetical protein